jgi:predicted PurR-regulated permease PerM
LQLQLQPVPAGHGACQCTGMTPAQAPERRTLLLVLLAAVSLALVAILAPFYGTLLWALIVALLFTPFYRWLLPRMGGRRWAAALLTMLAVLFIVVLPFVLITMGLVSEAAALYARLQSAELNPAAYVSRVLGKLPSWTSGPLQSLGLHDVEHIQARLAELLSQGAQMMATQALHIGQNTFDLVTSTFIMLYIAFFLVRDGDAIQRAVRRALPLTMPQQQQLAQKFSTVIRATVKGNLLVAALQGALGGLAFWVLGLKGALLWAVLMGFLSLLPAIGAALVWAPVAVYYLSTGDMVRGVGLVLWGVLVIGLVDNLLRPVLVGKDTRMPDWVVLVTTLGGMSVFGINGFVLGPVIAAMFFAVWPMALPGTAATPGTGAPPARPAVPVTGPPPP